MSSAVVGEKALDLMGGGADPKAQKTPDAEGVVLGGVAQAVVVAKSDADPKGPEQPAADGISVCGGGEQCSG